MLAGEPAPRPCPRRVPPARIGSWSASTTPRDRERIDTLFRDFPTTIEWMSVESAEMVKHAINAFLATSIAFTNEVAAICERVGADAREVERGLRSRSRASGRARTSAPGAPTPAERWRATSHFSPSSARVHDVRAALLEGTRASNDEHQKWAERRLVLELGDVRGRTIGVLGLTYKPGTDTLRRSGAVRLCQSLVEQGAKVRAYDPAIAALPDDLVGMLQYAADPIGALAGCDAAVVATEWPEFKSLEADAIVEVMMKPVVIDPNAFLKDSLGASTAYPVPIGRDAGMTEQTRPIVVTGAGRGLGAALARHFAQLGLRHCRVRAHAGRARTARDRDAATSSVSAVACRAGRRRRRSRRPRVRGPGHRRARTSPRGRQQRRDPRPGRRHRPARPQRVGAERSR